MDSTLLEHPRSPFMDHAAHFQYDLSSMEPYLQYSESPYAIPMNLPNSSPLLDFNSASMNNNLSDYSYSSSYTTASPARPFTPPDAGISPPTLYPLSAGEMSSDGMQSGRLSRGSGSHSPSFPASVPRSHRYNPIAAPATRSKAAPRRRASKNDDSDDDDEDADFQPAITSSTGGSTDMRRETIRRQRIESEQRRRDELRDGYRRLKDALPVSNQKSSKVSLLDRATTHVKYLEMTASQLQTRLQQAEAEVQRLRTVNEALMLGTAEQRHAAAAAAVAAVSQHSSGF
ncbi:hypothetical protein HWV62_21596 [Athelia sp. TMB]|nr:hypothetical protein HWV62_21596 [Athelia sp. TMB]